ncbi:aconitate hydratase AcnA [Pseudooceanicola nitratireducens]|uniref:aconitate hydratase AcnA n=1 Tax=Pseudooceanicola nitratireducens TaxID=517719 RepID=UPI00334082A5
MTVTSPSGEMKCLDLGKILGDRIGRLPHVLRLLAENHLRETGDVAGLTGALSRWIEGLDPAFEFAFRPNRILMHDTTCTPALADVAAMRDVLREAGHDPEILTPYLPVEVSVDHSVAVDIFGSGSALAVNTANEIARNAERYAFMKWAAGAMKTLNVNPPGTGIMHTINLEQLATLAVQGQDGSWHADMMIGTDSHTPMINGIGVLAWGVGGLEAETAMFGQALSLAFPEVVGVRLTGKLRPGTTATDLALEVTHQLRKIGVTGSFVEFFGEGVSSLTADDRAVVANMTPEYGASTGFFPADAESVEYLRRTGRGSDLLDRIEPLMRAQGLWFDPQAHPKFDREITIDQSALSPLIAGPKRPQDRLPASSAEAEVSKAVGRPIGGGDGVPDGAIGIAAITSCTNTSSPRLLVAAGLVARNAVARGIKPPEWVKTSLAPGSPSAHDLLERAGLMEALEAVGFGIVGYGCTTCIGNSGPLPEDIEAALAADKAVVAVLSGNRNFPGRVHPKLDLGFLASPPLVVAFALKGVVQGDILSEPIAYDRDGQPVMLAELWPDEAEIDAITKRAARAEDVVSAFVEAQRNADWAALSTPSGNCFPWDPKSRDLRRPAFVKLDAPSRLGRYEAVPLLVLGDDITTDHISPAGWISPDSAAGRWLIERGGDPANLNVYASYRGNWEVMLRGLFTNRTAINHLAEDLPPATTVLQDGSQVPVHEAAARLDAEGTARVILAGHRYGMGSSRDWAAKGAALLGVSAVIAQSFERIHRSNLIGMGILPLRITDDFVPAEAGIKPQDQLIVDAPSERLVPRQKISVVLRRAAGEERLIEVEAAVDTVQDVELLRAGGVLPTILRQSLGRD